LIVGGGIATTTITTLHPVSTSTAVRLGVRAEVVTWLVSSAACDVLLTASLVYSLVCFQSTITIEIDLNMNFEVDTQDEHNLRVAGQLYQQDYLS
jgi:hypothetical protein